MALTEIATATGGLPDALMPAWGAVDAEQRRRTAELLQAWQNSAGWREDYGAVAHLVDDDLALTTTLPWADGLGWMHGDAGARRGRVPRGGVELLANDEIRSAATSRNTASRSVPGSNPKGRRATAGHRSLHDGVR